MISISIIFTIFGICSVVIGTILIFKNNPPLTGFGCFNGPSVDKKRLFYAKLGLGLLCLGIVLQGTGSLMSIIFR